MGLERVAFTRVEGIEGIKACGLVPTIVFRSVVRHEGAPANRSRSLSSP